MAICEQCGFELGRYLESRLLSTLCWMLRAQADVADVQHTSFCRAHV